MHFFPKIWLKCYRHWKLWKVKMVSFMKITTLFRWHKKQVQDISSSWEANTWRCITIKTMITERCPVSNNNNKSSVQSDIQFHAMPGVTPILNYMYNAQYVLKVRCWQAYLVRLSKWHIPNHRVKRKDDPKMMYALNERSLKTA